MQKRQLPTGASLAGSEVIQAALATDDPSLQGANLERG